MLQRITTVCSQPSRNHFHPEGKTQDPFSVSYEDQEEITFLSKPQSLGGFKQWNKLLYIQYILTLSESTK